MTAPTVMSPTSQGDVGDILHQLQCIVEATPRWNLVTPPIPRTLLAETIAEIARLRAENQALMKRERL